MLLLGSRVKTTILLCFRLVSNKKAGIAHVNSRGRPPVLSEIAQEELRIDVENRSLNLNTIKGRAEFESLIVDKFKEVAPNSFGPAGNAILASTVRDYKNKMDLIDCPGEVKTGECKKPSRICVRRYPYAPPSLACSEPLLSQFG